MPTMGVVSLYKNEIFLRSVRYGSVKRRQEIISEWQKSYAHKLPNMFIHIELMKTGTYKPNGLNKWQQRKTTNEEAAKVPPPIPDHWFINGLTD